MIKRVCFFWDSGDETPIDTMINEFIENTELRVVDVKYCSTAVWNGKEIVTVATALAICEEE